MTGRFHPTTWNNRRRASKDGAWERDKLCGLCGFVWDFTGSHRLFPHKGTENTKKNRTLWALWLCVGHRLSHTKAQTHKESVQKSVSGSIGSEMLIWKTVNPLAHLILDLLTGVSSLPLLWPFTGELFKLPFGILPSAGRIALTNRYFYRNLIIESGILLPVYSFILMKGAVRKRLLLLVLHVLIFIPFLVWGITLER